MTDDPFTLLAWSETQNGLPVEKETPHGSFKFGSVNSAVPCMSETRFVWRYRLLPELESTSRASKASIRGRVRRTCAPALRPRGEIVR